MLALDEPAAGMNAAEKVALGELLTRIRDDGKTLLMIEHDVKLVMGICDRLTVLDYGKTLASGTPESVRRDPAVVAAGLEVTLMSELLKVERLDVHYGGIQAVRDVSFTLREGEQATLIGAGKAPPCAPLPGWKALAAALTSAVKRCVNRAGDPASRRAGDGPGGPRDLFPHDGAGKPADGRWLRRDTVTVRREMNEIFERFPRLGERQHQLAGLLSGGEQQLLALNRALLSRPRLLILDEPSMGLAPKMVENIFAVIAGLRAASPCCLSNKTPGSRWR